uniref:Uncharacterized protein n=1 Tax=Cacopsylla melanoneura TaxID=428564 RepID=A0A8D8XFK2_9HEMI
MYNVSRGEFKRNPFSMLISTKQNLDNKLLISLRKKYLTTKKPRITCCILNLIKNLMIFIFKTNTNHSNQFFPLFVLYCFLKVRKDEERSRIKPENEKPYWISQGKKLFYRRNHSLLDRSSLQAFVKRSWNKGEREK